MTLQKCGSAEDRKCLDVPLNSSEDSIALQGCPLHKTSNPKRFNARLILIQFSHEFAQLGGKSDAYSRLTPDKLIRAAADLVS